MSIICGMYHFLSMVQSAVPIPVHIKMLVFKTYIYNCKYSNRKYCSNSQFNTYFCSQCCSINCTNRQLETKGVIQTVSLSIQWMNTLTCQWGLKSDVIMVTSPVRTLCSVPSVSALERFDCVTHFGFAHSFCAPDNSINIIIIICNLWRNFIHLF